MADFSFPHPPSVPLALVIDLKALVHNYRTLSRQLKKGTLCAAVVKANAYGLGIKEVVTCLYQEGCRHFFVAHLSEAIELKCFVGKDAFIYALNGLRKGDEQVYAHYQILPVLSDFSQVQTWNSFAKAKNKCLKAALHFDTGMMRTGIPPQLSQQIGIKSLSHTEIVCVMSHLACPYQPTHPMNESQRQVFENIQKQFPFAYASLANSGGTILGSQYHYDMVRIGLGLTGCRTAVPSGDNPLKPTLKAYAQVLQINEVPRGESIGYNATFLTSRASRIATLGVGYADGFFRSLSNQGDVYFQGQKLPLVGRISMDLCTVDVTDVPPNKIYPGTWVELFGDHLPIDTVAEKAGTISWELMTRLGSRFERFYLSPHKAKEVA